MTELKKYLNENNFYRKEGDKRPITHTRIADKDLKISGGSYHIPDEYYEDFMEMYFNCVFVAGEDEYMTEKQLDFGPICIDLDFRYPTTITTRQHTPEHNIDFVMLYAETMKEVLSFYEDYEIEVYVMERSGPVCLAEKTKDGVHLLFNVNVERVIQQELRERVLKTAKDMFSDLPTTNTWEEVIDMGITDGTTNWNMIGSKKPAHQPYKVTQYIVLTYKDNEWCPESRPVNTFKMENHLFKLSARCATNRPNTALQTFGENITQDQALEIYKNKFAQKKAKTKKKAEVNIGSLSLEPTQSTDAKILIEVIQNLPAEKYIGTYGLWNKIGFIFYNTDGYDVNDWYKAGENYTGTCDRSLERCEEHFSTFKERKEDERVTERTAWFWLKKENLTKFNELCINTSRYITTKILNMGENDIARYIAPTLKEKLVYSGERWYLCDQRTNLWRVTKEPAQMVVTYIQTLINEAREILLYKINRCDAGEEKDKLLKIDIQYIDHYRITTKITTSSTIKNLLKEYLFEADFNSRLNDIKYQVAYRNGLLDLRTLVLGTDGIQPQHYLTKTIPYDYEVATAEDELWVKQNITKICNNTEAHTNYFLGMLGYFMCGDASLKQNFWYIRGQSANNGKSVIFEALMKIIANLIVKLESNFFEINYGSRHKEIACWSGIRIAWVDELSQKQQDETVFKELSNGTPQRFKVMFGEMDTQPINFKMAIVSNYSPNINADKGIQRRLNLLQFDSQFVKTQEDVDEKKCLFLVDEDFVNKLATTYKHALLGLIYKYSNEFCKTKNLPPYPEEWDNDKQEVIKENDKFVGWFEDTFELDPNEDISKTDLETRIKEKFGNKPVRFRDELKKMKLDKIITYDSQLKKNGDRGFWKGLKLITENQAPPVYE